MDISHSFVFAVAFLELQHMCRALEHCHHLLVIHIKLHGPCTSSVYVYVIGIKLGNYATQVVGNNCLFGEIWRSGGRKGDILKTEHLRNVFSPCTFLIT